MGCFMNNYTEIHREGTELHGVFQDNRRSNREAFEFFADFVVKESVTRDTRSPAGFRREMSLWGHNMGS